MSSVLVFGGNRATGLEIVKALKARGDDVSVMARPSADTAAVQALGVPVIVGQASSAADVLKAVSGGNFCALVCAVGGSLFGGGAHYEPVKNIIAAAKAKGHRRVVLISSIGVGDSRAAMPKLARWILKRALDQKELAEADLKASGLDYTIIQPGNLTNGPATSTARLIASPTGSGRICRADVGRLAASVIDDTATFGKSLAAL